MIHAAVKIRTCPLVRALRRSARDAGLVLTVVAEYERPWATATFVGALHRVELAIGQAPAFAAWLAALSNDDLDMRGHVVVDLVVEAPATIVALVMRIDDQG